MKAMRAFRLHDTLGMSVADVGAMAVRSHIRSAESLCAGLVDRPETFCGNSSIVLQWLACRISWYAQRSLACSIGIDILSISMLHSALVIYRAQPALIETLEMAKILAFPFECVLCLWPSPCRSTSRWSTK